jgi:hypothetical protein
MSTISSTSAAAAAAAAARQAAGSGTAPARDAAAPPFVRDRNAGADKGTGLLQFTQINGVIPRMGANVEGAMTDLKRIMKDVKSGNLTAARDQLDRITEHVDLSQFFKEMGIDPKIMDHLKKALNSSSDPAVVFDNMTKLLKGHGLVLQNNKVSAA